MADDAETNPASHSEAPSNSDLERVTVPAGKGFQRYLTGPVVVIALLLLTLAIGYLAGNFQAHTAARNGLTPVTGTFTHRTADPVKSFWGHCSETIPSPSSLTRTPFSFSTIPMTCFVSAGASDNRGARVDPHLAREFASNPTLQPLLFSRYGSTRFHVTPFDSILAMTRRRECKRILAKSILSAQCSDWKNVKEAVCDTP